MRRMRKRFLNIGLVILVACQNLAAAAGENVLMQAEDQAASPWVEDEFAKSRLVASFASLPADGSAIYLGWEVVLPEGWKTYWRSPGEAGKPPTFSWTGSENLGSAEPRFPLPERFELFDIQTFGYGDRLVLPIRIAPRLAGVPVVIRASVDYLVCKDICVPLDSSYELTLPVSDSADQRSGHADAIFASLAAVPDSADGAGKAATGGLEIRAAKLFGPPGSQRITIEIAGDRLLTAADIFLEAGNDVMFDAPRRALLADGTRAAFTFSAGSYQRDLDISGREITVTASDGWGHAIEDTLVVGP